MHTPQQLAAAWHRHAAAIKRQAYAFEPAPLSGLGMSAKRARGPAGHMMAQSRCNMHAGLPKARRQQKQRHCGSAAQAGSLWTDVSGHHRRALLFPL